MESAPGGHGTASARAPTLRVSRKQRVSACREFACEYVFRPAAHPLVLVLARTRITPPMVVAAWATVGLCAASLIWVGALLPAAILLQAKTILDNADGQLARATRQVSWFGRYLDSESDLLLDAAVFAGLGHVSGRPWLAAASFCSLTAVLSANYNLERLYRIEHREAPEQAAGLRGLAAAAARVYAAVYAPQDRAIERFARWRTRGFSPRQRRAYHLPAPLAVVSTFGLSTQLAVLGAFLLASRPAEALWVPVGCLVSLVPLELHRYVRARLTPRGAPAGSWECWPR